MRYKQLGETDMNVSVIGVGTWQMGGERWGDVERKENIAAIREAFENGVNFIDTAPAYGKGYSETVVAEAIKGYRNKIFVATKVGIVWDDIDGPNKKYAGYDSVIRECEASLKRLDIDMIDLYMVHWPDVTTPIEETMRALNKLKEQGKIRHIGVSNFSIEQMEEVKKYATLATLQPPYSMVSRDSEEIMKWCKANDVGTITYGSLGSGVLTGAYRELPKFEENDWRLTFYPFYKEPMFSQIMELLKKLDEIAANHRVPVAQVALNWSTQNPIVDTALVGMRNPKEAKENCAAMSWSLSDEEIKDINSTYTKIFG